MPKIYYTFFCCVLIAALCYSCTSGNEKKFRIGISQLGHTDAWRKAMKEEIDREAVFYPELEIIYKQADYNSLTQVKQIEELVNNHVDLLIVSPYEAKPLTPIIKEVYAKGVPVIIVDRNINAGSYTSFIGADNLEVGKLAASYIANYLNKHGNILEITGLKTSTPAQEREKGFFEEIKKYPGLQLQVINGDWLEGSVQKQLPLLIDQLKNTNIIFAHNDVMANTAAEICRRYGLNNIKIVGVDALPGTGLNFVENKTLLASVLYPTGGSEAIREAHNILNKIPVPKRSILKTIIVDSTNVTMMQQQFEKIVAQQKDIVRQENLLHQQQQTFRSQKTMIVTLLSLSFILLCLAGALVYFRKKNIRANTLLQLQNEEISSKSEQIKIMADKAAEANEARINFFTNITHELKTPLTLILAPADEAIKNTKLPNYIKSHFILIKKNASRLLALVNQLIDIRKIELNKSSLKVQEIELNSFIKNIIESFSGIALQHNIDCRLIIKESPIHAWIDPEKIEKVIFNLISNSFKFTQDGGYVYITTETDTAANRTMITITDSGVGMTEEEKQHLFEAFYRRTEGNPLGTGLGLTLSKEFVAMHGGNITVQSEKNRGTTFIIELISGKDHYKEEDFTTLTGYDSKTNDWLEDYAISIYRDPQTLTEESTEEKATILVVEDNNDLRNFLHEKLSAHFFVVEAGDGTEGIKKAFEEMPDIILSDIMMPKTNGIELTRVLKNDIRTKNIPILLLTAKTSEENKLEGLKSKADAYITKPFNMDVLVETLKNFLENREKLKSHISSQISREMNTGVMKGEKVFLNHFNAIIEKNISNESFSIQDICNELGISRVQLYRKLKPLLAVSANDHITNMRIEKAKYYLKNEDFSISEIAYKTGFSSATYFSTAFKKVTGETPKDFKNKN